MDDDKAVGMTTDAKPLPLAKMLKADYLETIMVNLETCGHAVAKMHIAEIEGHIAALSATIAQQAEQIAMLSTPQMFWDMDDPEISGDSLEELADYKADTGTKEFEMEVARAHLLPIVRVKCTREEDGWVCEALNQRGDHE